MSLRSSRAGGPVVAAAAVVLAACTPTSLEAVQPSRFVAEPQVSGEAAALFGDRAEQAYDQLSGLLLEEGFALAADEDADPVAVVVDPLAPAMTPDALDYWRRTAEEAARGDGRARDVVDLLRITDLHDPELVARHVVSQQVSEGAVDVAPGREDALVVDLETRAVVAASRLHRAEDVVVERDLRVTLVDVGDEGWLVSEFEGDVDWSFEHG